MGQIVAQGLGKAYKSYPRQIARLAEWLTGDRFCRHTLHWVLRGVDFSIEAGESVAVIGQNGAGKSTLLKLIAGVAYPSEGSVSVRGRTSALLELGLGFHAEFTGRQNLRMAAQLIGLSNRQVDELTPWMLEFADIGDYIDEPLRTYSSGMQMRLAFAIAVAKRPDTLIVDEALSVGDIFFQQKCFDLIRDYNRQGTTLLFVTHGMGTVQHLCERALLIDHGRLQLDGTPKAAIDLYESMQLARRDAAPEAITIANSEGGATGSVGSLVSTAVSIVSLTWQDANGKPLLVAESDSDVALTARFHFNRSVDDPHLGFKIRDKHGLVIYETNTYCQRTPVGPVSAGEDLCLRFAFTLNLREGEYNVTLALAADGYGEGSFREQLCYAHGLAPLTVLRRNASPLWDGVVNLKPHIARLPAGELT